MTDSQDSQANDSASGQEAGQEAGRYRAYWRSNLRLMAVLLVIWFVIPYGLGIVFVEPLNQLQLAGFPLGFWFAQQGAIYVFLVLVLVYALWMRRLDREHGVE